MYRKDYIKVILLYLLAVFWALGVAFWTSSAQGYDRLGNMSTRGNVVAGQGGAMITGFIADGTGSGN